MKTSAEKSSATSASVNQAARQPFIARKDSGGFLGRHSSVPAVQMKMTVNTPGDKFEQEADRTADRVMRMPTSAEKLQRREDDKLQRTGMPDDKLQKAPVEEKKLQRDAAAGASSGGATPVVAGNVQSAIQNKTTGGEPLSSDVRGHMEPRFGADFSNVRIHRDAESASLSNQLSARAFTYQNHIFFSRDQYQPGASEGQHLLAHELTHTIQQGHAVQRSPEVNTTAATPAVQRLGVQDALDKFAEWAYAIPGFRLLTLVIGFNPVNMRSADRNAANLLRALIELMPGGSFITQALDNHGVINKAASWIEQQLATLGNIGAGIIAALRSFMDSLSWTDIFDLGGVWERAKRIFTEPIGRLISFATSTATELLKLVKDAILKPLAALAQGTRGYDLLCAILGEDPVTGEPVARTTENLLGGFMKLIGQEEIWENIKKGNAIARAWAWFQGALSGLMGMVRAVPGRIVAILTSLTFVDIITIAGAFGKVVKAFLTIAVEFVTWGLTTIWNLLEIIFDVVSPGLIGYIRRTGAALKSILKNPMPFLGNLMRAGKLGFTNFADRIGTHLKAGLIDWLTGSLEGVYIPKALTLPELGRFALSVLGITWAQIRGKIVKALGPNGEKIMQGLELAFDVVKALVVGGVGAAWELIKGKLTDLKDQVTSGIISFVVDSIVKKAIPKILAMFIPGAGFISAIISIYDTVMVFVQKISKIIQVVTAFIDSIVTIAAGNITAAANRVESVLAGLLSLAISFLAGFLGLGKVTDKIMGVVQKIRTTVDKALDAVIGWIVGKAKALFARLFSSKDKQDERTEEQKKADLQKGVAEGRALLGDQKLSVSEVKKKLPAIKAKYKMTALDVVVDDKSDAKERDHIHGAINPELNSDVVEKVSDDDLTVLQEYMSNRLFASAEVAQSNISDAAHSDAMIAAGLQKKMLFELKPRPRDPFTPISLYSFNAAKADPSTYSNRRNYYGFNNAMIPAATEVEVLNIGLDTTVTKPTDTQKKTLAWHRANGMYACVRTGTGGLKYSQISLGHKGNEGASDYWNRVGHQQTKSDNQAWNNAPTTYWGPESNLASKGSGTAADLYRIPAKFFDSNAMWF
ncbi:DUF4157 domain-containing protein [Rhizobium leguminosarum]|nr:DUF4157 domain-containing protein [Rhizobium leguminosarum]